MQKLNTFCTLNVAAVGNGSIVVPPMPLLEDVDLSSFVPMSMMNATTDGHVPISLDLAATMGNSRIPTMGTTRPCQSALWCLLVAPSCWLWVLSSAWCKRTFLTSSH
jgi:hypothetical protein